jgi:hypothetical protein
MNYWKKFEKKKEKKRKGREECYSIWFVIKDAMDRFHHSFQACFRAYPLCHIGVNLKFTTKVQKQAKAKARAIMQAKGYVVARSQT